MWVRGYTHVSDVREYLGCVRLGGDFSDDSRAVGESRVEDLGPGGPPDKNEYQGKTNYSPRRTLPRSQLDDRRSVPPKTSK